MCKINCIQIEDMFMLIPAGIYLFKVNNRNTRTRCEICSKLTINTPERRQWRKNKNTCTIKVGLVYIYIYSDIFRFLYKVELLKD